MVRELKHTEIGDIPVDWELQTFDETFRVISNNTLSRENLNNRGGAVRNIHYGDILTKFPEVLDCNEKEIPYVNELSLLSSSTQLLQDGDIVVADTAEDETVGKVIEVQNLGDSKLVAGLHTIPCRVKKGDFAPGWLGYYMNSDLFHNQILPYITGIKVSSISKGAISETLILVPPFDEQEKIVQSLNKIQLLMTAETKVVNKIKLVKNGCLSKMFPQKDDTVPEMRLPGFTEAWEQRKLGELVEIGDIDHRMPETVADGIPYLMTGDFIATNELNFDGVKMISEEDYCQLSQKIKPEKGDILFARYASVGAARYVDFTREFLISYSCAIIKKSRKINSKYLYHFITSNNAQRQIKLEINTGSQANIGIDSMKNNIVVSTPSTEEQTKIADVLSNLDYLITLHQRKCDKYSNIKKGMMSDLLTGKIRLV